MMPSHDDFEPPLSQPLQDQLQRGLMARAILEEEVISGLRTQGLLRSGTLRAMPWMAAGIAASIAFACGVWVGESRARGNAPSTTIDIAGQTVRVEALPNAPAIEMIRAALAGSVVRAPLVNRAVPSPKSPSVTWF